MATVVPHPHAELERLYSEHGDRVRAICASILRNRHEAEDAAQQVFVAALRALRGGTVPRDAAAWLATIARHESWARARHSPAGSLPEGLEDRAQEDPATTVVRRAELAETWETIASLPATQREALLLREVRGLGYDEVADDLRLSRASVRSLLNRARTTLRMQVERGAAVFTGAEWVNVIARLLDSASSPALPTVGRAAAVGLGALAIAGGAVVGSEPAHRTGIRPAVHHAATSATAHGAAAVPREDHRTVSSIPVEDSGHRGERSGSQTSVRDSSGEDRSSGGPGPSSTSSGSEGGSDSSSSGGSDGGTTTSGDIPTESTGATALPTGTDGGGSSGSSGDSSGSSDGGSSASGSSDGGTSGSSGSGDGGSTDGGT